MIRFKSIIAVCLLLSCHYVLANNTILKTINGDQIAFNSLKGKWIFINYWASWCQPCLDEIRELNRFYHSQHTKAALFAVNYDMLPAAQQLELIKNTTFVIPVCSILPNN